MPFCSSSTPSSVVCNHFGLAPSTWSVTYPSQQIRHTTEIRRSGRRVASARAYDFPLTARHPLGASWMSSCAGGEATRYSLKMRYLKTSPIYAPPTRGLLLLQPPKYMIIRRQAQHGSVPVHIVHLEVTGFGRGGSRVLSFMGRE